MPVARHDVAEHYQPVGAGLSLINALDSTQCGCNNCKCCQFACSQHLLSLGLNLPPVTVSPRHKAVQFHTSYSVVFAEQGDNSTMCRAQSADAVHDVTEVHWCASGIGRECLWAVLGFSAVYLA